jgi:hypothetical protein
VRNSLLAVDSAAVALHVLASPGLPASLYLEELVADVAQLLKYQLQYNGLAFYDDKLCRAWRGAQEGGRPAARLAGAGWFAGRPAV